MGELEQCLKRIERGKGQFVTLAEDENGVFVAEGIYFNENSLPFGKPFVRGKGFTKENNAKVTVDYGFYKHPNVQKGKVLQSAVTISGSGEIILKNIIEQRWIIGVSCVVVISLY